MDDFIELLYEKENSMMFYYFEFRLGQNLFVLRLLRFMQTCENFREFLFFFLHFIFCKIMDFLLDMKRRIQ